MILSLCDFSGNWSRPYEEAGYPVTRIDLKNGQDVRLFEIPGDPVHGILAAPPCDHFAVSGSRWWARKGESALLDGLSIADACLRIIIACRPVWWALENPVGRLSRYLGPPSYSFNPNEFGQLADDPASEAYTKRTCLWGKFTPPLPLFVGGDQSVPPTLGSKMHRLPPSKDRKAIRSATPEGFARAFFLSNP